MKAWFVVALLLTGATVVADEAATARAHYDKGTTLYDLGQYREAAHEYEEAFRIRPVSALLFNIGQAYRLAGDKPAALRAYRSYLRREPQASNRAQVEDYIAKLDQALRDEPAPPREPRPAPTAPPPAVAAPPPAMVTPAPPPSAATAPLLTSAPPAAERAPTYKKWWVWTIVGVAVAAGVGVGLGVGLTQPKDVALPPGTHTVQF